MPMCNRCGVDATECHEISSSTSDHMLQTYKYASGEMIDGQKIYLCDNKCWLEFIGMLQSTGRLYADPVRAPT
jgi:hypothetical protein